ncbi:hypothetical protein LTR17_012054 [Elasticomyces elasticus]|nr:hypothetical protein LTR17_012054 [Elasticomyces elasticus]
MVASIGRLQHLAEPRSLSHKLSETYRTQYGTHTIDGIWYVELLLVFAIGQLLQGETRDVDGQPPGFAYFEQAMDRLPNSCTLQRSGTIGIEIMGFITFYLQCSDRKDDAYVYVRIPPYSGKAVINIADTRIGGNRIEACYSQPLVQSGQSGELRPTGESSSEPFMVDDLHAGKVSFALYVYGHNRTADKDFLPSIQRILVTLGEVTSEIPLEHALDFSQALYVSRVSATLHLMLYQATMLLTRPILLHLVKVGYSQDGNGKEHPGALQLVKLSNTCMEAADRTLRILFALKEQQLLAKFGFFDLDATLSVAFVSLLAKCRCSSSESTTPSRKSVLGACEILRCFASHGNLAAAKRIVDVHQMCENLGIPLDHQVGGQSEMSPVNTTDQDSSYVNAVSGGGICYDYGQFPESMPQELSSDTMWQMPGEALFPQQSLPEELNLEDTSSNGYLVENNTGLEMTGVIDTDWDMLLQTSLCGNLWEQLCQTA